MTKREQELLEIALEVLKLNDGRGLDLRLTGSLMLALRGVQKPREAHDIDFLITEECEAYENYVWCPIMPQGYVMDYDGNRSQPGCIKFYNKELDVNVDFIPAWEKAEFVNDIPCGSIEGCLEAKQSYSLNDKQFESKQKHKADLEFIEMYHPKYF